MFDLSQEDEILEIHEMPGRSGIFLEIRTRIFRRIEGYYCNKIGRFTQITEAELMYVLGTTKGEQSVLLRKDIADNTGAAAT